MFSSLCTACKIGQQISFILDITMKYVLAGKSCISLLDAKKCSTKFWCSAADDSALCEASEDIHVSASYEESGL